MCIRDSPKDLDGSIVDKPVEFEVVLGEDVSDPCSKVIDALFGRSATLNVFAQEVGGGDFTFAFVDSYDGEVSRMKGAAHFGSNASEGSGDDNGGFFHDLGAEVRTRRCNELRILAFGKII